MVPVGAVLVAGGSLRGLRWVVVVALFAVGGCNVFQGGRHRPAVALSEREFVDVYVALGRATTPEQKQRVLEEHGTSRKELQMFINAYANDLSALSAVFDSVTARLGAERGTDVPALPY